MPKPKDFDDVMTMYESLTSDSHDSALADSRDSIQIEVGEAVRSAYVLGFSRALQLLFLLVKKPMGANNVGELIDRIEAELEKRRKEHG